MSFPIFVKVGVVTMTIEVDSSETIVALKEKILAHEKMDGKPHKSARNLRLVFAQGTKLENDRVISDYNITKEATIVGLLRTPVIVPVYFVQDGMCQKVKVESNSSVQMFKDALVEQKFMQTSDDFAIARFGTSKGEYLDAKDDSGIIWIDANSSPDCVYVSIVPTPADASAEPPRFCMDRHFWNPELKFLAETALPISVILADEGYLNQVATDKSVNWSQFQKKFGTALERTSSGFHHSMHTLSCAPVSHRNSCMPSFGFVLFCFVLFFVFYS